MKRNNTYTDKIIKLVDRYKIISFDIFDTAIKRDVCTSKEVFTMIARSHGLNHNFANNRITAEKKCREDTDREEVTLEEIYLYMRNYYEEDQCILYRDSEINAELSLCQRNKLIGEIYDCCIKEGKIVIFVSDMYLPLNVIKRILKNAGYSHYEKVYLSSELMQTKERGTLYDTVLKDLRCNSNQILHIGDNLKSDFLMAKKYGFGAYLIPREIYTNNFYDIDKYLLQADKLEYQNLTAFINNHINQNENDVFFQYGYEAMGPLLTGFIRWLDESIVREKVEKVFFLSRDGQIMKKAYEIVTQQTDVKKKYMYASRRALIVPTLWTCTCLDDILDRLFMPRFGTISSFLAKIGLDPEEYKELVESYRYKLDEIYTYEKIFKEDKFLSLFNEIEKEIKQNSIKEFDLLVKYLKQIEFSGKVAIVDIGWNGNMQMALKRVCSLANINVEVTGFYIGIIPNAPYVTKKKINAHGFLFEPGKNESFFETERTFTSIFEIMFTANHGSTKTYELKDGTVHPVFESYEYKKRTGELDFDYYKIENIQNGALSLMIDVTKNEYFQIKFTESVSFQNMLLLGTQPNLTVAKDFGNMKRLEGDVTYIAKPDSLLNYIKRPKSFRYDLSRTSWRIGFFRRLLRRELPYYSVYMFFRKGFLIWRDRRKKFQN